MRIETPRLVLEPMRESRFDEAFELIDRGIHDPSWMPFEVPFTDTAPPLREQEAVGFWLGCWAGVSPEGWRLPFAVFRGGAMVGQQDVAASAFPERRVVETGSWLGREHQGRGYGREMRAAVLHLAFGQLGAQQAVSNAFEDNTASRRVSESLGYVAAGTREAPCRGEPATQVVFTMDRPAWYTSAAREMAVTVDGVDDRVLRQLGVATAD